MYPLAFGFFFQVWKNKNSMVRVQNQGQNGSPCHVAKIIELDKTLTQLMKDASKKSTALNSWFKL